MPTSAPRISSYADCAKDAEFAAAVSDFLAFVADADALEADDADAFFDEAAESA